MHSRLDDTRALLVALVLALTLATPLGMAQAQTVVAPTEAASPPVTAPTTAFTTTPDDVARAVTTVRSDPNLGGPRTERSLRLKADNDKKRKAETPAPWLVDMVRWMSEAGRGLMWLLGAVAVAFLIVFAWRWMRVRADAAAGRTAVLPPSHVNDLDIRPDSLPDDIAGSARTLWQRGEQRAALSLLYRGALSRLVHDHGVAIGSASTEGECVALTHAAMPAASGAFFERLVGAWQIAVYAARLPDAASVAALLDGFDAHFAPRRAEPKAMSQSIGATA